MLQTYQQVYFAFDEYTLLLEVLIFLTFQWKFPSTSSWVQTHITVFTAYSPWSVAKQSMMSILSQRAFWSSSRQRGGFTWPLPWPMLSKSLEVRKRWWGATSQVTCIPDSFAIRMISIYNGNVEKEEKNTDWLDPSRWYNWAI